MEPLDQHLFTSNLVEVAAFRIRIDDPRFPDTGPIQRHIFVFPRTSVRITHVGARPVVADANIVMFYNRAQVYRRDPISGDGDRSEWFSIRQDVVVDAIAVYDPSVYERPHAPYPFAYGSCERDIYLGQRALTEALKNQSVPDPLQVEEGALELLHRLIDRAFRDHQKSPPRPVLREQRELVEAARAVIGRRFSDPLTLEALSAEVRSSPFHLSRVFRAHTGLTVHKYLNDLRLRASLEQLADADRGLTDLALDLGFASHSHFTERFRKAFGAPPSVVRGTLRRSRIRELSSRLF